MINYLNSERYRLFHKKSLYFTSAFFLLVMVIIAVMYRNSNEAFLSTSALYYLSTLIVTTAISFFIIVLFNSFLTGKDNELLKQAISFGVTRNTIFLSKLALTLVIFLFLFGLNILTIVLLGENLFTTDPQVLNDFLIAVSNLLPLLISAFTFGHLLRMLGVSQIVTILSMLFVYGLSNEVAGFIFSLVSKHEPISQFFPSALLADAVNDFFNHTVAVQPASWIISGGLIVLYIAIGLRTFGQKNIE